MSWWTRGRVARKKAMATKPVISFEAMEGRALMATSPLGGIAILAPPPGPPLHFSPALITKVEATNPALYRAFETFLADLETAIDSPQGLQGSASTLNSDVQQIVAAAPTTSAANQALSSDVNNVTTSGTLTTASTARLTSDLTTILTSALSTPVVVSTTTITTVGTTRSAATSQSVLLASLDDANGLGTAQSGVSRGQGVAEATTGGTGSTTAASPGKTEALGNLLNDLKAAFAKATNLGPTQKSDLRADFVAITAVGHKPDATTLATFKAHIAAITGGAKIDSQGVATLTGDLSAVLNSAGVSSRLAERTQFDLAPVLKSTDLAPGDVGTILDDFVSVLLNLPATSAVPAGPASWFLGKNPIAR